MLNEKLKFTKIAFVSFLRQSGLVLLYLILSMVIGHYYVNRLPENDAMHSNFMFVGLVTFLLSAFFALISIPMLKFTRWIIVSSSTLSLTPLRSIKIFYITWLIYILVFVFHYFI